MKTGGASVQTPLSAILVVACLAVGCGGGESEKAAGSVGPGAGASSSEKQKIAALLDAIEKSNITFIRNDQEYPASAARQFMEAKIKRAGSQIKTAGDFIGLVATRSTTTGKPYQVRFADGRTTESACWLRARLAEIERSSK